MPVQEYHFDDNARVRQAYQHYLALDIPGGDALIRQELAANPHNLLAVYVADYADFFQILFNGNGADLNARRGHQDERLDLISKAPGDHDPWKLFCKAGINLHWAILKARNGENLKAATSLRRSYLQIKENVASFPAFRPNAMLYGLEEAVAGCIPKDYQWLAGVVGVRGDVKKGGRRLQEFVRGAKPGELLFDEAWLCGIYLNLYLLNQPEAAWQAASNEQVWPATGNIMRLFVRANVGINVRRADAAIVALRSAAQIKGAVTAFPVLDYELGSALLLRLDKECTGYLQRYATVARSPLFVRDALYKAALAWYLQGQPARAAMCLNTVPARGSKITDADKQATRFAAARVWPRPVLLQARLLTDGGYARQALGKLSGVGEATFTAIPDRLEYHYRLGRAQEEAGEANAALVAYQKAIALGRTRPEQYAARAALQMGLIYEGHNQPAEARRCFQQCLDMSSHDFQASLDQQAKAGLSRLGK